MSYPGYAWIWGQVRDDSTVSDTGLGQFRMILNWKENMSNYDKLYKVLSAWYTPDQINEIWTMLKEYDETI